MSNHSTAHAHHHPPAKLYVGVLAALLVLTIITVLAAGIQWGSPSMNVVIALAIATVKASLVALYFMHLRYDKPMNALILLGGLLFLGVFLGFCLIDENTRPPLRPANLKDTTTVIPGGAPLPGAVTPAAPAPAAAAPTSAPAAQH